MEIIAETPVTLAWLGDAVYSLAVREHLLSRGFRRPGELQKLSAKRNSAAGQRAVLEALEPELNEDELEIVRRGRNAHPKTIAKNADLKTYLSATALEALFGYLSLYNKEERMEQLLARCMELGDAL